MECENCGVIHAVGAVCPGIAGFDAIDDDDIFAGPRAGRGVFGQGRGGRGGFGGRNADDRGFARRSRRVLRLILHHAEFPEHVRARIMDVGTDYFEIGRGNLHNLRIEDFNNIARRAHLTEQEQREFLRLARGHLNGIELRRDGIEDEDDRPFNFGWRADYARRGFGARREVGNANNCTRTVDNNSTTFKWRIQNFSDLYNEPRRNFSDDFKLDGDSKLKLAMFLDAYKFIDDDVFAGLFVRRLDKKDVLNLNIHFWIESDGQRFSDTYIEGKSIKAPHEEIGFAVATDQDKEKLLDALSGDDPLLICCEITNLDGEPASSSIHPAKHDIGAHLYKLYQEGVGHDVTIQADGKEFKILSAVFMSQSDIFKQMLSQNFKEGQDKVVKISDIPADVMESFICWMYTGRLLDDKIIEELFIAADKYIIEELKTICAKRMTQNLTEENAAKRLALASTYSDKEMERRVLKFIASLKPEKIKRVFESPAWFDYLALQPRNEK